MDASAPLPLLLPPLEPVVCRGLDGEEEEREEMTAGLAVSDGGAAAIEA